MSFAIIQMKKTFTEVEVKVKDYYMGKNRLWSLCDGEYLLHYGENSDSRSFLREIGVIPYGENPNYLQYTDEEMKKIFKYYLQKGELYTMKFDVEADEFLEDELERLYKRIDFGKQKSEEEVKGIIDIYDDITCDILSQSPLYLKLSKKNTEIENALKMNTNINLYQNSVLVLNGIYKEKEKEAALEIYEEIFGILDKPFSINEIKIIEREKDLHHLKNAHRVLTVLFELVGDDPIEHLQIGSEEYETIKNEMLKYTKEFETKKVYK